MAIDWGSVPDWLAGVGALTALFFARTAAISARASSDMQSEQITQLQEENRRKAEADKRAVAGRVAVYLGLPKDEDYLASVQFVSAGELPIYDLTIYVFTPTGSARTTYAVVGPQPARPIFYRPTLQLRNLIDEQAGNHRELVQGGGASTACTFRDAVGVWWCRTAEGRLVEAAGSDEAERLVTETATQGAEAS